MNMLDRLRDARTVRKVRTGDRAAFRELVERYARSVQWVAYAHLGNHEEAEDVCQDTFLKAFESFDSLRQASKIGSWLLTLARNRARDILRRRATETAYREHIETEPTVQPQHEREDTLARVRVHLAALSEDDREVLVLHYFEGRPSREIAALLGITPAAARKRMQRAREALGERLVDEFGVAAKEERKPKTERIMALVFAAPAPKWMKATPTTPLAASIATKTAAVATVSVALITAALFTPMGQTFLSRIDRDDGSALFALSDPSTPRAVSAQPKGDAEKMDVAAATRSSAARATAAETSSEARIGGGSISGRVYFREDNAGLPGAVMGADSLTEPNLHFSAESGTDGRFLIDALPAGSYRVSVRSSKSGQRCFLPISNALLASDQDSVAVDFALTRGKTISGHILDERGQPRQDAKTFIDIESDGHGKTRNVLEISKEGDYQIQGILPGNRFQIRSETPSGLFGSTDVMIMSETDIDRLDVTLLEKRYWSVSGCVTDLANEFLPGVKIALLQAEAVDPISFDAVSGPDGRFLVRGYGNGPYFFKSSTVVNVASWAIADNPDQSYGARDPIIIDVGDRAMDVVLQIDAGKLEISGRVVDSAGVGLPKIQTIAYSTKSNRPCAWGVSDESGRYALTHLKPGTYRVSTLSTGMPQDVREDVPAGSVGVDLHVGKPRALRGRVVDAKTQRPVTDFEIAVTAPTAQLAEYMRLTRVTNAEGRFELEGHSEQAILVRARGYAWSMTPVPSSSSEDIVIALLPGLSISGTVLSIEGDGIPGARILPMKIADLTRQRMFALTHTDNEGRFEIFGLPLDTHALYAHAPGYVMGGAAVSAERGSPLTIILERGGSVSGRILCDGKPLPGRRVGLFVREESVDGSSNQMGDSQYTKMDGSYFFEGVSPGTVSLTAYCIESSNNTTVQISRPVIVRAGENSALDIEFDVFDAEIQVSFESASGASECRVMLVYESSDILAKGTADGRGVCRIGKIPAGAAMLTATWVLGEGESRTVSRPVMLVGGEVSYETVTLDDSSMSGSH